MNSLRKISVTGLGYVGLTIAIAFSSIQKVIGYDLNKKRIKELQDGHDINDEISENILRKANIFYTSNPKELIKADFHIVAVSTPLSINNKPDFSMLLSASKTLGENLKRADLVVYESSVFPGVTEEKCIPALESTSKLICGRDFAVGYSPERVNPADKTHRLDNIIKIIAATDPQALEIIATVYNTIIKAGLHRVSTIRIAEASKIVENIQRDVNISFVNEIALILHAIGMDSVEVLKAAQTKWNFLPFKPGLVGGHCIGVNAYYLLKKADEAGFKSEVIRAVRKVNEYIPEFIALETKKKLSSLGVAIKNAKIAILGITYKENCSILQDSKVIELIKELAVCGPEIITVHDPYANPQIAKKEYEIELRNLDEIVNFDVLIIAVAHKYYTTLKAEYIKKIIRRPGLIMDIKGILNPIDFVDQDLYLWRL